jgi:NADH:ubiquinone oxidoreductase subunit 4 (subunit M)
MNFSLFGLFSLDFSGILGGSLLIFSHAFTSSALFYLVGFLYSQFHSRLLPYFQGLSHILPIFSSFFFLFSLCNISLPFTFSFLSEFLLLSSSLLFNPIFSFFLILSLLLSSSFFFLFSSKLLFGPLSPFLLASSSPSSTPLIRRNASDTYLTSEVIYDISLLDFFILLPFLFFSFFFSLFPSSIISFLSFPLLLSLS